MRHKALVALALCGCFILVGCSGGQDDYTQAAIQAELTVNQSVESITWAPDGQKVAYWQPPDGGLPCVHLWLVGEAEPGVIGDLPAGSISFSWSPNSHYLLISAVQEKEYHNAVVVTDDMSQAGYRFTSTGVPIWSPDGEALVFAGRPDGYGDDWGSLQVYSIATQASAYIWKTRDASYAVHSWDEEGNITYTEVYQGQAQQKVTQNIKPDIAGVRLGDTRDQVVAALGSDYQESLLAEPGHFPEQVLMWDYAQGYQVIIGQESGKVLEISATAPAAKTNLGVQIGDAAGKVFAVYRPHYLEPESIHGGKLYGIFKVEGAAALCFDFTGTGAGQYPRQIPLDAQVERMKLTYPVHLDDSF